MLQPRRGRKGWTGALLCGLVLRVLFLWIHPRFVGDTLVYGDLAHNLLAHHVYGLTEEGNVRSTLIRLPGYPLFLALCFALFGTANYLAVLWVQAGLDLLSCVLLGLVAEALLGRRTAQVCVWLAALCPFTANYAAAALTETASIFCVVLAFWGLVGVLRAVRREQSTLRPSVVVGAALSGAVLLRPDGILLAGAVLPCLLWVDLRRPGLSDRARREGRASAASWYSGVFIAAAIPLLCLGLWTLRNWEVLHAFQPLAPKYANDPGEPAPLGFARWYRTWGVGLGDTARVYWEYDGSVLSLEDLPSWAFDSPAQRTETCRVYARYNEESSSTPASEADFARLADERIRAHPVRFYLLLPLARLGDMWLRPRTELFPHHMPLDWWRYERRPKATMFAWLYGLLNLGLLICSAVGLLRWRRLEWTNAGGVAAAMVGYVVLRSLLLMTIDNSEPRYVLEAYPVVLLLAALALSGSRAVPSDSRP